MPSSGSWNVPSRAGWSGARRIGSGTLAWTLKSFLRGQSYVSVMVDLEKQAPRVLEVCEGRKKEDASELILTLPEARREPFRQAQGPELVEGQIKAVAMDMSPAYQGAVAETLPQAAVVFDKFHVSKLLGDAVDKVRRGEHKRLAAQGDERLSGTRYAWLYHPDELMARRPDPARDEAFEALAFSNLQTAEEAEGTREAGGRASREPTTTAFYFWSSGRQPTSPAPSASLPNGITKRGAAVWNPSRKRLKHSRITSMVC